MKNLQNYAYKYALVPYTECKDKLGLPWRKTDLNGMALINYSDIKCLAEGEGFESVIAAVGGVIMTPDEARYYRKTATFSAAKHTAIDDHAINDEEAIDTTPIPIPPTSSPTVEEDVQEEVATESEENINETNNNSDE